MSRRHVAAIFDASNEASPISYKAANTALLLMDYHNMLVGLGGEHSKAALAQGKKMSEWAAKNGVLIVHCLIDLKATPRSTFKGKEMINMFKGMLADNPGAADEHPEIGGAGEHEVTVMRLPGHISVLKSPGLGPLLEERGIKSLVLCGIATSGCVLSTARSAGDEDYVVTVIEDACWDPVEGVHDMLKEHVFPGQVHVATAEEFQSKWAA